MVASKSQAVQAEPTPTSGEGPVCNILIADDEVANLVALEAILEPLGQRVVRATSGVEALRHALSTDFCVVLLDVQMPDMDGIETAELLRRRRRTRNVPVIFLTAVSKDPTCVARGYEAGAVDYLFKPYDPDALRTKVATFVQIARKNELMRARHEALRVGSQQELADFKRWSERRYEDLADSMPQIVWTADALGNITYHNQRWPAPVLAGNESVLRERRFTEIVHPEDLDAFSFGWSTALRAGVEWEAELRIGAAKKGYRFHLVRAVPRRDEQGKVIAWVGTATDIDARVRPDQALRILADASDRLNRSLGSTPVPGDDSGVSMSDLEVVLASALPTLGDGAILDVHRTEPATGAELSATSAGGRASDRLQVVRPGIDPARLADPRFDLGPATVAYTGRAEVISDVEHESRTALTCREDPEGSPSGVLSGGRRPVSGRGVEHLRFLGELGVSGYMCVPLVSRNRTIGTLTLVRFRKGERYDEADAHLAKELARRIALAIDNARLHATTERRREELELANRSKDVFLATLSHELRTPLNAIVGWTDMMKNGGLQGDELVRAIETIDRNALALSGLVGDLLDVSRIVTGTLKLESKYVSLAAVVESAVVAARPQCASKEIALLLTIDTIARAGGVMGDSGRLRQVITNLLSNAIKFTPNRGTVSVRVEGDGQRLRVVVSDTGEGIAAEFLPHVFERFRQEETSRIEAGLSVARQAGLGLGLAIVKHLVEEHRGTVSASSEGRGKGATFVVDLPVASESARVLDDLEAGSVLPTGEPDLAGVHVLIVEDDPDGNELACTILQRYGARVTSVTTAAAALDTLATARPQILVSDIGLPDMDGMALIKAVRARPDDGAIPAVALTAYASRQDATKAIAAGFDAHVAKPVQPATLGSVVVRLLARGGAALAEPCSQPPKTPSSI